MAYGNTQTVQNGTVLSSMTRLNNFLALEVARKEKKDKETSINKAGQEISNIFKSLPANATPRDVNKALYASVVKAGENSALLETLTLIGSLTTQAQNTSLYEKKIEDTKVLGQKLKETLPYDTGDLEGEALVAYINAMEKIQTSKEIVKGKKTYLAHYNYVDRELKKVGEAKLGDNTKLNELELWKKKELYKQQLKNSAPPKISDLKTWYETSKNEVNRIAAGIYTTFNPEATPDDLNKMGDKILPHILSLTRSPELMKSTITNAIFKGGLTEAPGETQITTLATDEGVGIVNEYGIAIPKSAAIPRQLVPQFADLFSKIDEMNRASYQIMESMSTIPNDIAKEKYMKEQELALSDAIFNEASEAISDPTNKYNGFYTELIRTITGDKEKSIDQLIYTLSPEDKKTMFYYVYRQSEAQKARKRK